jgi:hypothetical protein
MGNTIYTDAAKAAEARWKQERTYKSKVGRGGRGRTRGRRGTGGGHEGSRGLASLCVA